MFPEKYYQNYEEKKFRFSRELLTRYCLSLYTKPFVILSGISGTGKTKIAQLFTTPQDDVISTNKEDLINGVGKDKTIILSVTPGIREGDGRGNFKFSDLAAVYESIDVPNIKARIDELKAQEKDDNITEPAKVIIVDDKRGEEIKASVYLQRANSPLLRVRFKSKRGEQDYYNSTEYFQNNYNNYDVLKLEKIGPYRFRIISVNDEEIIKTNEKFEKIEARVIQNIHFASVRSNWTDSTEIFGYFNLIEQKYHVTPILKFLLTAQETPSRPFFLILDEMNLSKVEHYFSDFLSCLESRILDRGELKQEQIHLHSQASYAESDDIFFDVIPGGISLPQNLYVSGTVNIDETTYMFSPKVLDRANVIEFNEVDLDFYTSDLKELTSNFQLSKFPEFGKIEVASKDHYLSTPSQVKELLKEILNALKPYNLHFGYRVINEISLFVNNCIEYINAEEEVIFKALDFQITQKILPKFSGSHAKLDVPLRQLIFVLLNKKIPIDKIDLNLLESIDISSERYPTSLLKLIRMYRNLYQNGFASFIE